MAYSRNGSHAKAFRSQVFHKPLSSTLLDECDDYTNNLVNVNNIESVDELEIRKNNNLQTLEGLEGLQKVGDFSINDNTNLVSLDGLISLVEIASSITIRSNNQLSDFCALKPVLNQGFSGEYNAWFNLSNPTVDDIINNCP